MNNTDDFREAVKSAVSEWLDAHTSELITEIAKQLPDAGLFVPVPKLAQSILKIRTTYTDPDEYPVHSVLYADMVITSLEMELTEAGYAISTESPEVNMRKAWTRIQKG